MNEAGIQGCVGPQRARLARRWLALLAATCVACGACSYHREPVFEGRSASDWAAEMAEDPIVSLALPGLQGNSPVLEPTRLHKKFSTADEATAVLEWVEANSPRRDARAFARFVLETRGSWHWDWRGSSEEFK